MTNQSTAPAAAFTVMGATQERHPRYVTGMVEEVLVVGPTSFLMRALVDDASVLVRVRRTEIANGLDMIERMLGTSEAKLPIRAELRARITAIHAEMARVLALPNTA